MINKGREAVKFANNKKFYIRRTLFFVLILFTAAFQHTGLFLPEIFGARAMLLIPLCVCIAMFERSMGGLVFGVLCGVLWDAASARGDGFFSVCLACVGFLTGLVITHYMRNNILASLIISGTFCVSINFIYWLIFIALKGYEGALTLLMSYYLPSAVYSFLFTFVYYYLVRFIVESTHDGKRIKSY